MNTRPGSPAPRPRWGMLITVMRVGGDLTLYAGGVVLQVAAITNVPGAALLSASSSPQITSTGIALFLLGLVAWVSIFFRRVAPLAPLIAGAVLAAIGSSYLLLLIGAFSAIVRWPAPRIRQVIVASSIAVALFVLREFVTPWGDTGLILTVSSPRVGDDTGHIIAGTITILLAIITPFATLGTAVLVRTRRERESLRDSATHERSRAAELTVELTRQSERERLARDIHDALAHRLSVISLQSGALEEAARSHDETVARAAQTLRLQAHASLDDLRGLLGELRSEPGGSATEEAAVPPSMASMRTLGHLIRSVREGGTAVDALVLIENAEQAGAALDRTTYRIVQESLTNALKHAPGMPVALYVEASAESGVRIRVSNPLPSSDAAAAAPGAGRGLTGIHERASLLGGTAWTDVSEGQFVVDVSLPWPHGE